MKKLLLLSSLLFLLVACNGIDKDLHTKGEEVVKIIHNSHETLHSISDEDSAKVFTFFTEYPFSYLEDNTTKEQEFIFNIEYLETVNNIYIMSISNKDQEKAEENLSKYKEILSELENEFNITVN